MPDAAAITADDASRSQRIALIALPLGALGIAFAPIFVRLSEVGPVATGFWRVALAVSVLGLWMGSDIRSGSRRPTSATDYARLTLAGLCFAGDLAVWHISIHYTSVANSTLLANFAPIFVAPAAWLLFKERLTGRFVVGMLLALAGAMVLMGQSFQLNADHLFGDALALLAAMFYGGYILTVGRLRATFSTATIMTWTAVITAAVLLPISLAAGEPILPTTAAGWLVLAGLALVSHAGGQSLIAYALAHLPASFSSVSLLLQPAAAAVLAWMLLGEPLGSLQAAGAAVILLGVLLARRGSR
ncbi:DMT family transporter [Azospirillum picis]|uniref:Drug/metabolite transporter (DMT)-like permease n=1 Tax=Azospirillum picis TaxID=488438 RepID=A0ABU0MRV4_9PROT|nr:DMT family transporter [Azospirillum picis]MBP2302267.1 drug/metabolite transporter (DMT)-like permease [Azospirillum picis]MDQ0535846.1 drug/metabolite transporter (DMT)-like permease [Azospirillum picis]